MTNEEMMSQLYERMAAEQQKYKGEAPGSDKRYSFAIV